MLSEQNVVEDINQLWDLGWQLLGRGRADKKHAFNTPVVCTVGADGTPRPRTVVLRDCDRTAARLSCWTDRRSVKADHLLHHPYLGWHFWDRRSRVQLTGGGPTHWAPEAEADAVFGGLPKHSRRAYATLRPPAAPRKAAGDGLPDDWAERDLADTDYAAHHFGILHTRLAWVEILLLDRAGHRRLRAERAGDDWSLTWITP